MSCTNIEKDIIGEQQEDMPFIDNQLWSIDRLAQFVSVPAATIRDWVYKRKIPFVKVGRHIRFIPSDVLQWIRGEDHGYNQD